MNIDKLIEKATLEKNGAAKEAYRAIKAELLLNSSAKKPKSEGKRVNLLSFTLNNKPDSQFPVEINELDLSIIRKLISEREESISMYDANSRKELADIYREQNKYLKELLPAEISEDIIKELILTAYPTGYTQKEIGKVMALVKSTYPTADMKKVGQFVKSYIL